MLNRETVTPPPIWMMRQAGRYLPEYRDLRARADNFLEFCYRPELAVEAALQPLRRYRFDAAILFSDILVVPDGLGQKVEFKTGEGPVLEPIRSGADIGALKMDRLERHLRPVYEAVSRLKASLPSEVPLIGFAGAPWTVAVYMVEGRGGTRCEATKNFADVQRDDFAALIGLLVEATVRHLSAQIKNGAEVIQLFDSWAGVLDADGFRRWIVEPTAAVVREIRKRHPDTPIIGFPRGAGDLYGEYVRDSGVDGVGIDEDVSIDSAAVTLQRTCAVQGNLSNRLLVSGGEALDRDVRRILTTLGKGPFVFNLGHGILPETPPENVGRVVELVRGWQGA